MTYESLYDPPQAAIGLPGEFRARVWYRVMLVAFFVGVAAPLLMLGQLYVTGRYQPAGMSPEELRTGGVMFTAFGLVLGSAAVVFGAQVVARRGPVLRAFREGLEVRLFGRSRVYGVPSAPGPLRLTRALLSGRSCRLPTLRVPWSALAGVSVSHEEFEHVLIVQWRPEPAAEPYDVALPQSEIAAPVGKVAAALLSWSRDENARASLPGWEVPA